MRLRLAVVLIQCVLVWQDFYPVPNAPMKDWFQGVKIEVCGSWIEVSTRVYTEVQTAEGPKEHEVRPWKTAARAYLRLTADPLTPEAGNNPVVPP